MEYKYFSLFRVFSLSFPLGLKSSLADHQQMSTDWMCSSSWTREEDKAFENALAISSGDSNPWDKIAAAVPGRTLDEIKHHFEDLVVDVNAIDSDHVALPVYADSFNVSGKHVGAADICRERNQLGKKGIDFSDGGRFSQSNGARKRATPWTKDEHRLFLQGLKKYGRGDWRSISRHLVLSRTPTQIASHAQKFFKRLNVLGKDKKRFSIHDVTLRDDGKLLAQKLPETQQNSGAPGGLIVGAGKYPTVDSLGVDICTSSISSYYDTLNPQGPSTEQIIGDINFGLFGHPIASLSGISRCLWPNTDEMMGAADVGFIAAPIASQHGKFPYQAQCTEPMIDVDGVDITDPISSLHGISTLQCASTKLITGALNVDFCSSLITSLQNISTPQGSGIEQMTGDSDLGFLADPIGILPLLSTSQGPSTDEMIGATDVGLVVTPSASQHANLTYHGPWPLTKPMIDAAGVRFIADSMASHDGISTPPGTRTENDGLSSPLITIQQKISASLRPTIEQMIKDSDFGLFGNLISHLPGISTPEVLSSKEMIGDVKVGSIAAPTASQHTQLTCQGPLTEPMIYAAGVGLIADAISSQDGISTTQSARTERMTGAPNVGLCASFVTSHQNTSTPQGPVTKQMTAAAAVHIGDLLDTTQRDMITSQGPITGKMTESAGGAHIVDFGESASPCSSDFNFF